MSILWKQSIVETVNATAVYPDGAYSISAGAPMDACGNVANDSHAVGILLHDVKYPETSAQILVRGIVDLAEAEAGYGNELSADAKAAMLGILLYDKSAGGFYSPAAEVAGAVDAIPDTPMPYITLASSTEASDKVFVITVDDDGEITATELTETE